MTSVVGGKHLPQHIRTGKQILHLVLQPVFQSAAGFKQEKRCPFRKGTAFFSLFQDYLLKTI
jgi:hypothetical protein